MRLHVVALVAAVMLIPVLNVAQADVFNMPAGQTILEFVTVGDPGNTGEQSRLLAGDLTYYGGVAYS